MANWKTRLDLKDLWSAYDENRLTVQEVAEAVAERLVEQFSDIDVEELADQFATCEDVEEFDGVMHDLYDWADEVRCWVATRF